ncbi:MAG: pitrilysin family protein [Bacteroidota bacterium]
MIKKYRKPALAVLLGLAVASGGPAIAQKGGPKKQAVQFATQKPIETVKTVPGKLVIPYEKFKLANGLTVIVTEDHSDPIVHVDVTYHVGSAREEIGKSGFAHFFEHMMFQGSDNVGDEEHFKIVSESGGTLNGSTNLDRTNYFETLPKNQLERAMWLESDRMGFLLDAVTTKKFENQRETVKNERGQNYDNRPYGLIPEKVSMNLYPYGHPYSWLTIGYIEDLNRVGVQDLKNFFLRWYGPNNATLTVGGDVTSAEVLRLANKYFGTIPAGPKVEKTVVPQPVIDKDRYVSYEDAVRFPALVVSFPGTTAFSADEPALDCLCEIIGGGENSLFYKNFVKNRKAVAAFAYNPCFELGGYVQMQVRAMPGTSLASVDQDIRATLKEFEARGVTDEDLLRYKAKYESSEIEELTSVDGKVSRLANYQTMTGNPDMMQAELDKRIKLTKADVMNAYNKYIKGKGSVILSVVPKGKLAEVAAPDNYTVSKEGYKNPADQYSGLVYHKAKDLFDRSRKPAPGPNPAITLPAYWTTALPNGMKVIGTEDKDVPVVTMLLSIKGGHLQEGANLSKAGTANLLADMLMESTQKYSTEEMASELDKLGSQISIQAGADAIDVSVSSLTKNLDKTLALLEEKLFHPKFDAEDFDRIKKQNAEAIANRVNQATAIASQVYSKLLYGDNNILGLPVAGTDATIQNVTLEDVKKFYNDNLSPSVTNLVIVGDVNQATIMGKLGSLKAWPAKAVTLVKAAPALPIANTTIYLVDKEKAPQSEIRIGYVHNLTYNPTGEYYKTNLMNYILGGAFNSRINLNLREDKGWTYGARSGFSASEIPGPFTASAGIKGRATDSSVVEFMKEITDFSAKGLTDADMEFMKNSIGQSEARNYESPLQKASFLNRIVRYGLAKDFMDKQNEILRTFTKEEASTLAKKHLPYQKMDILVVGDKQSVYPGLLKLGYPVVLLDKTGNPVPSTTEKPIEVGSPAPTPVVQPIKPVIGKQK